MGVEAYGRHALGCRKPAYDRRRPTIRADHANVWAPGIHEQLLDALGAALHLRRPRRVGAHRLDGNQLFQIGEDPRKLSVNLIAERHLTNCFSRPSAQP